MSQNQKQAWLIGNNLVGLLQALVNVDGSALMGHFEVPEELKEKVEDFLTKQFGQLPSKNPVYQIQFSVFQVKLQRVDEATRELQIGEITDEMIERGFVYCLGVITGIEIAEKASHSLSDLKK